MVLTNKLIAYRDILSSEARKRFDANTLTFQKQLLRDTQREEVLRTTLLPILPAPIQSGFDRKAKSHNKTIKRRILRIEIIEKETDKTE